MISLFIEEVWKKINNKNMIQQNRISIIYKRGKKNWITEIWFLCTLHANSTIMPLCASHLTMITPQYRHELQQQQDQITHDPNLVTLRTCETPPPKRPPSRQFDNEGWWLKERVSVVWMWGRRGVRTIRWVKKREILHDLIMPITNLVVAIASPTKGYKYIMVWAPRSNNFSPMRKIKKMTQSRLIKLITN